MTTSKARSHPHRISKGKDGQQILSGLIESNSLSQAIKTVLEQNWVHSYDKWLTNNARSKEEKISAICESHFEDLIDSLSVLFDAKSEIQKLKEDIVELNNKVQKAGNKFTEEAEKLMMYRHKRRNIQETVNVLRGCEDVMNLADRADKLIGCQKYVSALKLLEKIQQVHLPRLEGYRIAELLEKKIPQMERKIKASAQENFGQWNMRLRNRRQALGAAAFQRASAQLNYDETSAAAPTPLASSRRISIKFEEMIDYEAEDAYKVNVEPVFQCLNIHKLLGIAEEFMQLYRTRRTKSADGLATLPHHMSGKYFAAKGMNFVLIITTPITEVATKKNIEKKKRRARKLESVLKAHIESTLSLMLGAETDQIRLAVDCVRSHRTEVSVEIINLNDEQEKFIVGSIKDVLRRQGKDPSNFLQMLQNKNFPGFNQNPFVDAKLIIRPKPQLTLGNYYTYLERIAGFFIIEDAVMKSAGVEVELMSRTELERLWEKIVAKLKSVLREQLMLIKNPAIFLEIKTAVVLLCRTLEAYDISTQPLYDFFAEIRHDFETIMCEKLRLDITKVMEEERVEPLQIDDEVEYKELVLDVQLRDPSFNITYPATMPFSISVPQVCKRMKSFIMEYSKFTTYLPHFEINIFKAVDHALIHEVNERMNKIVDRSNLKISQVVQLSVNAGYLSNMCDWLQEETAKVMSSLGAHGEIAKRSQGGPEMKTKVRYRNQSVGTMTEEIRGGVGGQYSLDARKHFQTTKYRCEQLIFELIANRIDDLMASTEEIDWCPSAHRMEPHDYINVVSLYLQTEFQCMFFMPDAIKELYIYTSCKRISTVLLEMLDNVKKFNIFAIYNLHLDVSGLEMAAKNYQLPGLADSFTEIRQIINIFMSCDIANSQIAGDKKEREKKYPRLYKDRLLSLMRRFKTTSDCPPETKGKIKKKALEHCYKKIKAEDKL